MDPKFQIRQKTFGESRLFQVLFSIVFRKIAMAIFARKYLFKLRPFVTPLPIQNFFFVTWLIVLRTFFVIITFFLLTLKYAVF